MGSVDLQRISSCCPEQQLTIYESLLASSFYIPKQRLAMVTETTQRDTSCVSPPSLLLLLRSQAKGETHNGLRGNISTVLLLSYSLSLCFLSQGLMQFRPALDSHEAVGDTELPSNLLSSPFQGMGLEMCAEVMGDPERGISSFLPSKCVPLYLAFKSIF